MTPDNAIAEQLPTAGPLNAPCRDFLHVRTPLGIAAVLLEAWVFVPRLTPMVVPPLDRADAVFVHLLAAALAGLMFPGWRAPHTTACPHRLGSIALMCALGFPVMGSLVALFLACACGRGRDVASEANARALELALDAEPDHLPTCDPADLDPVRRTWRAMDLASFSSLLSGHGDGDILGSAFASVLLLERPDACRLLRSALASHVPAIRYYASTALASIEEELDRELERCLRASEEAPADRASLEQLAIARLAYAEVGESDDPVINYHAGEGVRLLECLLAQANGEGEQAVRRQLARAYLFVGQPAAALTHLLRLVELGESEPAVLRQLAEAAHLSGDYEALRRHASTIGEALRIDGLREELPASVELAPARELERAA